MADLADRSGCCARLPKWSGATRLPQLYANQNGQCYVHVDGVRLCLTLAVDREDRPVMILRDTDTRRVSARGNSRVAIRCSDLFELLLKIADEHVGT